MGLLSGRLDRGLDLDEREVRLLRDRGSRRGRGGEFEGLRGPGTGLLECDPALKGMEWM